MDWLKLVHGEKPVVPAFGPSDHIRVWYRIVEQGKERQGQFEGTVIRVRGAGASKTFTVRRVTYGEGVERVFPVDSKTISKIEVLRRGKVKRSKLYYLRTAVGKTRIASADEPGKGGAGKKQPAPAVEKPADADPGTEKAEGTVPTSQQPADPAASPT